MTSGPVMSRSVDAGMGCGCSHQKHTCSFGSMSSEMHCSSARASHSEKLSKLPPWPGFPPMQSERQIVKKKNRKCVCVCEIYQYD